ncbi:hypothetical protein LZ518_05950 [Sphingomonas sp. RB56-2]|uniref:Uncharacterized protein n=1 Tax=Sphingomonas brevis TaxID=2908206 RepID=A0ABT0S8E6_9SPHN|nr:hypothetical protein [Sphingomonas brevis]MCL6740674.1 hypothetical protein [Sphingomonas brevis]
MMDFLWHLRGAVPLDGRVSNEMALDRVENLLERQMKPVVVRDSNHVIFEAPLWEDLLSSGHHAMVIYDQGRIWIDQGLSGRTLKYELRSLHAFVFCLLGAVMFFVFGLLDGGLIGGLKLSALAFGWVYGMNLLLALVRVPSKIRTVARPS